MQDPTLLTLSGFLVTFIIDLFNRYIKNTDMRRLAAYLFCIIWGTAINIVEHNANYFGMSLLEIVTSLLVTIGATVGFSQLTYKGIPGTDINWEDSKLRENLQLNAKTL